MNEAQISNAQSVVRWRIVDTPMRPRRWKLVADGVREDNSWTNYFEYYGDAEKERQQRDRRDNPEATNANGYEQQT
jgi:hypothetical protein